MTLPTTGTLKFSQIQTEFGGANPIKLSEYYAGAGYVASGTSGINGAIPTSGNPINVSKFRGSSSVFVFNDTVSTARTSYYNIMLQAIQAGYSSGAIVGTININANIYSAGSNYFPAALGATSLPAGSNITINIAPGVSVIGRGGGGGQGDSWLWDYVYQEMYYVDCTSGSQGRYGIYFDSGVAGSTVTIRNQGIIAGGGGGGGGGRQNTGAYPISASAGGGGGGGGGANYGSGGPGGHDGDMSYTGGNGQTGGWSTGGSGGAGDGGSGPGGAGGGLGSDGYNGTTSYPAYAIGVGAIGGFGIYGDNRVSWYGGSRGTVYGLVMNS